MMHKNDNRRLHLHVKLNKRLCLSKKRLLLNVVMLKIETINLRMHKTDLICYAAKRMIHLLFCVDVCHWTWWRYNLKLHICLEGNHDFCRLGATYPIITYLFVYRFRQYKNGSVYKIHAVILNDGPLNGFISYKILIEKEAFLSHCNKFENEMVRYLFCNCTLWCEDNIEKNFSLYVHSQIFFQIWFCTFWASILCVKNKKQGDTIPKNVR